MRCAHGTMNPAVVLQVSRTGETRLGRWPRLRCADASQGLGGDGDIGPMPAGARAFAPQGDSRRALRAQTIRRRLHPQTSQAGTGQKKPGRRRTEEMPRSPWAA